MQTKHNFSLRIQGKQIQFDRPQIMGILNLTPDSFYDGGTNTTIELAISKVKTMFNQGADIIDIGAMSSRPYSIEISIDEELNRLKNILPELKNQFQNKLFSIDTYRSEVAEFAINNGISIINDITAGDKDPRILTIAKEYRVPYIAMHMKGTPQIMQANPSYINICEEIYSYFFDKIEIYTKLGLKDVVLDVGFGFGKSIEDNYTLLKNLNLFQKLNFPILVGVSRKSMIYKPLNILPKNALNGSTALHFEALRQGASILRVHDILEAKEVLDLYSIYDKVN